MPGCLVLIMINYKPIFNHLHYNGYSITVLRLDLIHPEISGNKWFKLKYNLEEAKKQNKTSILTFGGAYSNHIAATAAACRLFGFSSIGLIRGEDSEKKNPTLKLAQQNGMHLNFISRDRYRKKTDPDFLSKLQSEYPDAYIVPEGGDNALGEKGCEEILTHLTNQCDIICCAYATGTTFRGVHKSLQLHQKLLGFHVLNYEAKTSLENAEIINTYHFGSYAKHTAQLIEFKNWFELRFHIPLDYVYTAKLFFGVFDMIKHEKFDKTKELLIIHSGGLQGNQGYETRYNLKPIRHVKDPHG